MSGYKLFLGNISVFSSRPWLASAICMLSFNEHKLLIIIKSNLSSFSFLVGTFSVLFKKSSSNSVFLTVGLFFCKHSVSSALNSRPTGCPDTVTPIFTKASLICCLIDLSHFLCLGPVRPVFFGLPVHSSNTNATSCSERSFVWFGAALLGGRPLLRCVTVFLSRKFNLESAWYVEGDQFQ